MYKKIDLRLVDIQEEQESQRQLVVCMRCVCVCVCLCERACARAIDYILVSTFWLLLARSVGTDLDASTLGQACVRVRFAVLSAHWLHDHSARTCLGLGGQCHGVPCHDNVAPRSGFRTFRTRTFAATT